VTNQVSQPPKKKKKKKTHTLTPHTFGSCQLEDSLLHLIKNHIAIKRTKHATIHMINHEIRHCYAHLVHVVHSTIGSITNEEGKR
jgi:hypothetical protein